jgi:hypothetical protein
MKSMPLSAKREFKSNREVAPHMPTPDGLMNKQFILEKCEELAREYFDGSGDVIAVAHSLRNVILARFEWVKKHGTDAGE